jgi:putative transposase
MPIHFYKLGELFKQRAVIQKERTPAWAIALGLALYAQGLSLRRTALTLAQLGVRVSHVAVWYWIQSFADNWPRWNGPLPERIVVDETQVKLGGRPCWIWAAIDPKSRRILYLRVSRDRTLISTMQFFQELAHLYGQWPQEAVVDGGPWYQGALFFLQQTKRNWMVGGIRNYVERRFREFKRRIKVFDCSFPQHRLDHGSITNWLRMFAWFHNYNLILKEVFNIS